MSNANDDLSLIGRTAEMLADVLLHMDALGMTQTELAARCGWSESVLTAIITGKKEPGITDLAKLATAVGCVWRLREAPTHEDA